MNGSWRMALKFSNQKDPVTQSFSKRRRHQNRWDQAHICAAPVCSLNTSSLPMAVVLNQYIQWFPTIETILSVRAYSEPCPPRRISRRSPVTLNENERVG